MDESCAYSSPLPPHVSGNIKYLEDKVSAFFLLPGYIISGLPPYLLKNFSLYHSSELPIWTCNIESTSSTCTYIIRLFDCSDSPTRLEAMI